MAALYHTAPRAFSKALPGARSAVFPMTAATLVTLPCDVPMWGLSDGDQFMFTPVSGIETDGLHLTHDGEIVMVNLTERSGHWAMIWPDGTREVLPKRDVANCLAFRLRRRVEPSRKTPVTFWQKAT